MVRPQVIHGSIIRCVGRWVRRWIMGWDRYWFREGSLRDLAVVRIVLVGFQLAWMALGNLDARVNEHAAVFSDADALPILDLLAAPLGGAAALDLGQMAAVGTLAWCAGGLALVGVFTRLSLAVFAWTQLLMVAWLYSGARLHHPEALMTIALAALALAPSGAKLSLDAILRPAQGDRSHHAAWPLLLVRWLLALAYVSAAWSKLVSGGLDWMNGYTLQYFTFVKGMALDRPLGVWISEHHGVARVLSIGALTFETLFVVVLLRPRLSPVFVAAGVAVHLGIYLSIGAAFFQFIALYVVFLPCLRASVGRRRSPRTEQAPPIHAIDGARG